MAVSILLQEKSFRLRFDDSSLFDVSFGVLSSLHVPSSELDLTGADVVRLTNAASAELADFSSNEFDFDGRISTTVPGHLGEIALDVAEDELLPLSLLKIEITGRSFVLWKFSCREVESALDSILFSGTRFSEFLSFSASSNGRAVGVAMNELFKTSSTGL